MLPRKSLPDQDVILCASLNRTMVTTNVHPLYLSPVVCWLNRTCAKVQRVKGLVFNLLRAISSVLVCVTIFLHIIRLWNVFSLGLLGVMWSLMVCITLIRGYILAILSSEIRSARSDTSAIVDPMLGVSLYQKLVMFFLFLATYIHTWVYYAICSETEIVVSWIECSGRRGQSLFPILKWTTFVFVWINTIGFVRLVRSR